MDEDVEGTVRAFRAHLRLVFVLLSQGHVQESREAMNELVNHNVLTALLSVKYQLQ